MKINLIIFGLLSIFGCSTKEYKDTTSKKAIEIIHDTIVIYDTIYPKKMYNISKSLIDREYNQIYKIIKTTQPTTELWKKLKQNTSPKFIMYGYLYNDKRISESTLLLFLKIYHNNLKGNNYLFDISCNMNNNIYLMLFVLEYYKISKADPVDHLVSPMVYEWIVNQPNYLKNKDIQNEVKEIENLLKKGIKLPIH